jgi:hypothetical protein
VVRDVPGSDTGLSLILGSGSADSARHPAVVVLHGCSGFSSHSATIADRLGSWGYVALTVGSFGPRGIASACGRGLAAQAFDAYAALHYLGGDALSRQRKNCTSRIAIKCLAQLSSSRRGRRLHQGHRKRRSRPSTREDNAMLKTTCKNSATVNPHWGRSQ